MGESLIYLTDRFPFHPGEHFLEAEINHLAAHFEKITLIPLAETIDQRRETRSVPENVTVIDTVRENAWESWQKTGFIGRTLAAMKKPSWWLGDLFRMRPFQPRALLGELSQVALLTKCIESNVDIAAHSAVASFWLNRPASVAAMLGARNSHLATFARGHGGDIYPQRQGMRHFPLQHAAVSKLDGVLCDSAAGATHIENKFPRHRGKISVGRLGVENQDGVCPSSEDGVLRVVSLSSLVPVKRVHLIAKALKMVERNTVWTHIGDGECRDLVESKIAFLPDNIQVNLVGAVSHELVIDMLRNGPFDVFINVSESEGLPVSIMEAFSFGIPVIATAAGGSGEIVDDSCGVIIPIQHEAAFLGEIIENFEISDLARNAAQKKQQSEYHDGSNQAEFAQQIIRIATQKRS
jgi:glycosyltransferase involved in cell wall biosynthesis